MRTVALRSLENGLNLHGLQLISDELPTSPKEPLVVSGNAGKQPFSVSRTSGSLASGRLRPRSDTVNAGCLAPFKHVMAPGDIGSP